MQAQIQQWAIQLGEVFKQRGWILAAAESCTGGGFSAAVTEVAGSSAWFDRGFVVYSNTAKIDLLGVSSLTLQKYGSVSQQVAEEMAIGGLRNSSANYAIAITGIAGPEGGSVEKPVGTVWIACAGQHKNVAAFLSTFSGDRSSIRAQTIKQTFKHLLTFVQS